MSYYSKCPHCGANLDPGETCDCLGSLSRAELQQRAIALVLKMTDDRQIQKALKILNENEETAQGVTSTLDGKVEQICTPVSTSILSANIGGVKYA